MKIVTDPDSPYFDLEAYRAWLASKPFGAPTKKDRKRKEVMEVPAGVQDYDEDNE